MAALAIAGLATGSTGVTMAAPADAEPRRARFASDTPQAALFEWSIPSSYGEQRDDSGVIVETDPAKVSTGPWRVRLQVAPSSCSQRARYRWSVEGRKLRTKRAPGCTFEATFAKEGTRYPVRLEIKLDGRTLTHEQPILVQDWLIVSIGDSVASGESVPDVPGFRRSRWQHVPCHRSARAAPAKAARQIEELDDHSSVTFVHLACSGATIQQGLLGSYDGVLAEPLTQPQTAQVKVLNRLARQRKVDAVLLSVGANDVYFGAIVRYCAVHPSSDCFKERLSKTEPRTINDSVAKALETLRDGYDELDGEFDKRIERPRVHIVDYFDPTHDARGKTCKRILGFVTASELESAQSRVLEPLNRAVASAADRHGWTALTGTAERFRMHGYCAGRQAWVTTLSGSAARSGGAVKSHLLGTLHPNESGQDVIAHGIVGSLQRSLYPGQEFEATTWDPEPEEEEGPSTAMVIFIAIVVLVLLGLVGWLGWALGKSRGARA